MIEGRLRSKQKSKTKERRTMKNNPGQTKMLHQPKKMDKYAVFGADGKPMYHVNPSLVASKRLSAVKRDAIVALHRESAKIMNSVESGCMISAEKAKSIEVNERAIQTLWGYEPNVRMDHTLFDCIVLRPSKKVSCSSCGTKKKPRR